MEWAQRCGKFEDVTLVEKHRVDSRFGVGGAAASSSGGEQRRPSEFSCCRGMVRCKGLVLTLRLRQLELCQFCGNISRGC